MTKAPAALPLSVLERLRADTPATGHRVHLDNAGASLMPAPVVDTIQRTVALEAAVGGYVAHERMADQLERSYGALARLIGANQSEIAFLQSATEAWNRAFYSLPLQKGDRIITGFNEYCSNYVAMLDRAEKTGARIVVIGPDAQGNLDLAALNDALDDRAKVIAISHVPSSSGQINPVKAVGEIARKHAVPFLLDACQSMGQLPVDVEDIGCHMLTGTARKFLRGPRGVGFLYIRDSFQAQLRPVMLTNQAATWTSATSYELRGDAKVMEAWERNLAAQLGFGAALDYLLSFDIDALFQRSNALAARLRTLLEQHPPIRITDPGTRHSAIVTFRHATLSPATIKAEMEKKGIAVQVASVVHTRLDLEARGIDSAVRVSPHYYNTEEELERFMHVLESLGS
ncbi:aminotransferase class V [Iodidimonas gelatinilytica]|uniref:Aminotransferase class V n=1 Tax=Iodidimonas gelatinilytica TaxID=1236966 RepID=A0A5A7MT63_9PROT|nr:aminotransferase class V-fold PLP-dependent enzyme [Iodidimonas gelatinilytica]GEQ98443.1 aminotransferase class V [Iodidimonas gelatinilytica]